MLSGNGEEENELMEVNDEESVLESLGSRGRKRGEDSGGQRQVGEAGEKENKQKTRSGERNKEEEQRAEIYACGALE